MRVQFDQVAVHAFALPQHQISWYQVSPPVASSPPADTTTLPSDFFHKMSCTSSQVLDVARRTIEIFEEKGLKCCLIGSVASFLYGVKRTPNVSSSLELPDDDQL